MYCVCWCDLDPIQGQGQGHGAFELPTTSEAVHAGGDDRSPLAGLSGDLCFRQQCQDYWRYQYYWRYRVALVLFCIAQQVVSEWENCGHLYMISEATGGSILWSPYGIGQTIIFLPCDFYLLLSFFPRLISAVGDWMSTILLHMVWP